MIDSSRQPRGAADAIEPPLSPHSPKFENIKEKRMLMGLTVACLVVSAIAIVTALLVFYWFGVRQAPKQVLGVEQDRLVSEEGGDNIGITRKELRDGVWRVFATVQLEQPPSGTTYHGWFKNMNTGSMRYAGEFFPAQDGKYSLTYTTQEDVSTFTTVQVSTEKSEHPQGPSNNVVQWEFGE